MVIIYGSGANRIDLGRFSTQHCGNCQKTRPHKLILDYKYEHVYWCKTVTEKQYSLFCSFCHGSVSNPEATQVESKLGGNPIPFWTRYGLIIFGVSLVTLVPSLIILHYKYFT
jgi:hypothetical protein